MDPITTGIATSLIGGAILEALRAAGKVSAEASPEAAVAVPVDEAARAVEGLLEQESDPTARRLVWMRLSETADPGLLTLALLTGERFEADHVCAALEVRRPEETGPHYLRLADLYRKALTLLAQKAIDQVPPDLQRALLFEHDYRAWLANDTSRLRLPGIRTPEGADLRLETMWVDLGVAALRQTAAPGEPSGELPDIASLEDMQKRLASIRRESGALAGQSVDGMLDAHRRLVIVGAPGSGKTTLMQYLAHLAARRELRKVGLGAASSPRVGARSIAPAAHDLSPPATREPLRENLLPFVFLVRSLDCDALPDPEGFIGHLAPGCAAGCPEGLVTRALDDGRALILVDGLDECAKADHSEVLAWLRDLTSRFPGCRFLVTSRPAGYQAGELRGCGYAEAELQPLGNERLQAFVRRWYGAAEEVAATPEASEAAERGAADLIDLIERTPSIRSLAANPLLLSLLCVVHRYRHESLPERRAQLLRECVEVLLHERREHQPGMPQARIGGLNAARRAALVRPLAWWMMEQGMAQARRSDIERLFGEVLPTLAQSAERAPEFLDHVRDASGLLVEQRPGVFAFSHSIFQEYLAAEHAQDEGEWDALLGRAQDERWREVMSLAAGLGGRAARALVEALTGRGDLLLAGRCVAASVALPAGLRAHVTDALAERAGQDGRARGVLVEMGGEATVRACLRTIAGDAFDPAPLTRGYALALPAAYSAAYATLDGAADADWADALSAHLPDADTLASLVALSAASLAAYGVASLAADSAADVAADHAAHGAHGAADMAAFGVADSVAHSLAHGAARIAADVAALSAAFSVAAIAPDAAALGAAHGAAAGAVARAADATAWRAAERVRALSDVIQRIGLGDLLGEVRTAMEGCERAEQRLYLWNALAEELDASELQWATDQLGSLPSSVYPLLRLCVIHRLRHRWEGELTDDQEEQLQDLVTKAERDLKVHFARFGEMVQEEIRRLAPGQP